MAGVSSGALDSAPAVTMELSVCRARRLRGGAGASLWSCALPASACLGGRSDPGLCLELPVLPVMCCWIRAPGCTPFSGEPLP